MSGHASCGLNAPPEWAVAASDTQSDHAYIAATNATTASSCAEVSAVSVTVSMKHLGQDSRGEQRREGRTPRPSLQFGRQGRASGALVQTTRSIEARAANPHCSANPAEHALLAHYHSRGRSTTRHTTQCERKATFSGRASGRLGVTIALSFVNNHETGAETTPSLVADHMITTMTDTEQILVVDDEPMVREVVVAYLERDGFSVTEATTGAGALKRIEESAPDLVVLDVMLPEIDGFSVLTELRKKGDIPVILLTARTEEPDRVLGLELGADDYVVKPFSPRELVARVRSVLRRSAPAVAASGTLDIGPLRIDEQARVVTLDDAEIEMTPKEFDLLTFLARSPRQVFSRSQLLEQVWDSSADWQDPSTVTVHVRRLRRKLETDQENPRWITTVWGVGYRFEP